MGSLVLGFSHTTAFAFGNFLYQDYYRRGFDKKPEYAFIKYYSIYGSIFVIGRMTTQVLCSMRSKLLLLFLYLSFNGVREHSGGLVILSLLFVVRCTSCSRTVLDSSSPCSAQFLLGGEGCPLLIFIRTPTNPHLSRRAHASTRPHKHQEKRRVGWLGVWLECWGSERMNGRPTILPFFFLLLSNARLSGTCSPLLHPSFLSRNRKRKSPTRSTNKPLPFTFYPFFIGKRN